MKHNRLTARYESSTVRKLLQALAAAVAIVLGGSIVSKSAEAQAADSQSADGESGPLIVCAVPNAMPRTGRADDGSPQGLDAAVIRLLAKQLGRAVEFHWCASASCSWNCVRERRCDLVIGQPQGSGPARDIAWSIPYSGSRFGLVVHQDNKGIHSRTDLSGKRVGVVVGSVAIAPQGHTTVPFKTREELLDDFVKNQLDAAFVDDDFAAWYLHRHPRLPLRRVAEYAPRERWNVGFAVRSADTALLRKINATLTIVIRNGQVSKLFSEQGVPYRAPFSGPDSKPVGPDSWKRIRERGEIVVSLDPANMPYSGAQPDVTGFDLELAREVARELGVKLRIDWIDVQRQTAIGQLLDGQCDLAFGAAVDPRAVDDEEELADKVLYSKPLYGTGYLLVTRKNGPSLKSLAELTSETSRRIGAEAGSVADYQLRQRGYLRRLFRTQLAVLKSLHDRGIDYAYLWANVGWTLHNSPEFDVELVADYVPEDRWNIAIAIRRDDEELKRHVDDAVEKLILDGAVARALSHYHVPYFPAFRIVNPAESAAAESKSDRGNKPAPHEDAVIRRQPTDRGLEPQMRRLQKSKQPYRAVERIRSAGVLVVGLDQNALPFSAAHPKPAGLDVEIAGLLAEKLGASPRIYWAYSSHDSYASKLASKKLCDVMLGVMPDDRFGQRVAFSKPYYFADYRFVVAAGADALTEETPLAAERGVALRGIRGRTVHEYPSLASILEAVIQGKEQAGYVVSSAGQWLAENRWPGKLRFVDSGADAVDRFPICAAVRSGDDDLNEAVNQALEELVQSGKLAEVFARWHIQYDSPQTTAQRSPRDVGK